MRSPLLQAQELLANISAMETGVSKLEEEMVALHFQLIQERNERRLVEYRAKQDQRPVCSHRSGKSESDVRPPPIILTRSFCSKQSHMH
jgi:hypothetical protein